MNKTKIIKEITYLELDALALVGKYSSGCISPDQLYEENRKLQSLYKTAKAAIAMEYSIANIEVTLDELLKKSSIDDLAKLVTSVQMEEF